MANEALQNSIALQGLFRQAIAPAAGIAQSFVGNRREVIDREFQFNQGELERGQRIKNLTAEFGLRRELSTNELANRRELSKDELANAITLQGIRTKGDADRERDRLTAARADSDIDRGRAIQTSQAAADAIPGLTRERDSLIDTERDLTEPEKDAADRRSLNGTGFTTAGLNELNLKLERLSDPEEIDELLAENNITREQLNKIDQLRDAARAEVLDLKRARVQSRIDQLNARISKTSLEHDFIPIPVNSIIQRPQPAAAPGGPSPSPRFETGVADKNLPGALRTSAGDFRSENSILADIFINERTSSAALKIEGALDDPTFGFDIIRRKFNTDAENRREDESFRANQINALGNAEKFVVDVPISKEFPDGKKTVTLKAVIDGLVAEGDIDKVSTMLAHASLFLDRGDFHLNPDIANDFLRDNFGDAFNAITPKRLFKQAVEPPRFFTSDEGVLEDVSFPQSVVFPEKGFFSGLLLGRGDPTVTAFPRNDIDRDALQLEIQKRFGNTIVD